jgi:hypothetical protein
MPATLAARPDISPITRLIRRTRLLLRSAWGTTGLGLVSGTALAVIVVAALIDMAVPLVGSFVRLSGLILFGLLTAYAAVVGLVVPMLRRLGAVEIARRIEAKIPGMHSRLVSCVDLAGRDEQISPAFYNRLVGESLERIRKYRATSVVDFPKLRKSLLFALIGGALFVALFLALGARFSTALARVFRPFADIPPVSGVAYDIRPGSAKVLAGEPVVFEAHVTTQDGPDGLRLELYGENGASQRYDLEKGDDGVWRREVKGLAAAPGFGKTFTYRVFGGGTWSRLNEVRWLDRPAVAGITALLHYPDYLKYPAPKDIAAGPKDIRGPDVAGPEDAEVEIVAETEGEVRQAEVQLYETVVRRTEVKDREEKVWFGPELPAGAQPKGNWVWEADSSRRSKVHTAPAQPGTSAHGFEGAAKPIEVGKDRVLFTNIYLDPLAVPEAVMLTWITDKGDAEHRAFWGANVIEQGKTGMAGRHFLGPIPKNWIGQWARVEVPAKAVELEGARVTGMYFTLAGGKAKWHEAGVSKPSAREEKEARLVGSFPMSLVGENQWSGRFPLKGIGHYRVRLANELGHVNLAAEQHPDRDALAQLAAYTAIADRPPTIQIDQPGANLELNKPAKVSLIVSAADDFGLAAITLSAQRENELKFQPVKTLKNYPDGAAPVRGETVVGELDLTPTGLNLKAGDVLRYRVVVRDRRPGSDPVPSKDFTVTIGNSANAADKQLEAFEKSQDPFREKLVQLIAEREKVKQKVDQTAAKYDALNAKIREAVAGAEIKPKLGPDGKPLDPKNPANSPLAKLDPETQKNLEALRKELAELFAQENKNVALAQQMTNELAQTAQRAEQMPLLDRKFKDDLKELHDLFQGLALDPLKDLAQQFQQGSQPQQTPGDLRGMKQKSDRLQNELKMLKDRADALSDAQKQAREDRQRALEQLTNELLKERGQLSARELADLIEHFKRMQEELARLKDRQMDLGNDTEKSNDAELPKVEKEQEFFDHLFDQKKHQLQDLLEQSRKRRQRDPMLPDDPEALDPKERKVPPREEDSPDPEKKKDPANPDAADPTSNPEKKMDEEEPLFMPNFANERPKLDPRFKDKQRPTAKKDNPNDPKARRGDLQDRQQQNLRDLDSAQQSLKADAKALEAMMQQLQQRSQQLGQKGQDQQQQSQSQQSLRDTLQSAMMQKALQMAQRARQQARQQNSPQQPNQPNPAAPQPNLTGNPPGATTEAVLDKLDLDTRKMLLALPPRVREDLIQGMKEEGPAAYRKFIRDYFRRLDELQQMK